MRGTREIKTSSIATAHKKNSLTELRDTEMGRIQELPPDPVASSNLPINTGNAVEQVLEAFILPFVD